MAAEAALPGDGSGTVVSLGASAYDEALESPIPCDVLEALLPGDDIVEIEKPGVGGGLGYRFAKRTFDLMSCATALVILAIPMAVIAVKIKIESPGPAIYAQRRVGLGGREFFIYKFRSMYSDAEVRGAQWAADGDPRVTPFGKKLRRTRLASVIIGTPGDGESTKSLSRSANSSLDLQLCERRPGLCCANNSYYKPFEFLSVGAFRALLGSTKGISEARCIDLNQMLSGSGRQVVAA